MKQLRYTIEIKASADKVWKVLWGEHSYRQWTKVFHESSYAESEWKKGSEIRFLTPEGAGMYSRIEELILNELMAFQHLGEIKDFINIPPEGNDKEWMNARESYKLTSNGKETVLTAELETLESYEGFFNNAFPKALEIVKFYLRSRNTESLFKNLSPHRLIQFGPNGMNLLTFAIGILRIPPGAIQVQ